METITIKKFGTIKDMIEFLGDDHQMNILRTSTRNKYGPHEAVLDKDSLEIQIKLTGKPFASAQVEGETHEYLEPVELVDVEFISVWDAGQVVTRAKYNPITWGVTDIESTDVGNEFTTLERQYIRLEDNTELEVEMNDENECFVIDADRPQTKSQFTPWVIDVTDAAIKKWPHKTPIVDSNKEIIGWTNARHKDYHKNTVLIHAAPDLLDACRYIDYAAEGVEIQNHGNEDAVQITITVESLNQLRQAINKARGK